MGLLLNLSINLSKIDKSKIKEGKSGAKYYDFTVSVNDTPNQWGQDVSAFDSQTKEQREAKATKSYLGNGKVFWRSDSPSAKPASETQFSNKPSSDDLPF